MTDQVELSIGQFVSAWRLMCERAPAYEQAHDEGLALIFARIPVPFFNVAIPTGTGITTGRLRALTERACIWAASRQVPWLFVVTHEAIDGNVDVSSVVGETGLVPLLPLTGMRADTVGGPETIPAGLRLDVPAGEADCGALLDVNAAAYGMDMESGKALMGQPAFWSSHFPVLGTVDGQPVSTTAVFMVDGVRYVALVATTPGHQRRGYADVTMRRALQLAAEVHGPAPTVLHATEAGRPVYERMGYQAISRHTAFIDKAFLGGH
jgi:GNAT superfamily N-acetyltransferase